MKKRIIPFFVLIPLMAIIAACGLTPEEVQQVANTVESLPAPELAQLAGTVEALPPESINALEQSWQAAGYPTLSPDQVNSIYATVESAKATGTAVNQAINTGERVNATNVPAEQAPRILYFFASVPSQAAINDGMRYYLNYTTENANRVEIFGHVMDNPTNGSFPIYGEPASDDWNLWAANDVAWVEQFLQVRPDADTGASLQNVTVDSQNITISIRDPQLVDADALNLIVNGITILDYHVTTGRHLNFAVSLQSGANTVVVQSRSGGATPPMVAELTMSNVTAGPAVQLTGGLSDGQSQQFTITAP